MNTQKKTFELTPDQAAMIYRGLELEYKSVKKYLKNAHRLEATPKAASLARIECAQDMEACQELIGMFYDPAWRPA